MRIAKNRKSANLTIAELKYAFKALVGVKVAATGFGTDLKAAGDFMFAEFGPERITEALKTFDLRVYVDTDEYDI